MAWTLFPRKRPTISKTTLDLLLIFVLMALFYGEPLLNRVKMSYGGDGMSLFLPSLEHYRQSVYNGVIPLWNSGTWLGAPFLATFQAAVLYPPQTLTLFFNSTVTGAVAAQNLSIFLSLLWLAYGSYILGLRALMLERYASIFFAILMGCSGFVGGHIDHVNQLAAICWIPWIMAEALILLRRPRLKNSILLALCLCMQILAGHPQYVVYTFIYLLGLVACYSVYYFHRRKIDAPPAWMGIVLLGLAFVLGAGLGSAQILPAYELAKHSVRQGDTPERMLNYSFPPNHLLALIAPNAFGNPATGLHAAFQSQDPSRFETKDIVDWPGFCSRIFPREDEFNDEKKEDSPSPGKRILEMISPEAREALEEGAESGVMTRARKKAVIRELNNILTHKYFYSREYFPGIVLSKEGRSLLGRDPLALSDRETMRLNRLLIEASFSEATANTQAAEPYDYNYGEFICYVGIVALALALLALATLIQEFVVRAFSVLALFSLLVSFGKYAGNGAPYQFLQSLFPGGEGMRVPARFLVFFLLSVSVLASLGFNQAIFYLFERRRIRSSTWVLTCLLILAVAFFDLYWFSRNQAFRFHDTRDVLLDRGPILDYLKADTGDYRIFRLMDEVQYDLEGKKFKENMERKQLGARLQIQRLQPNLNKLWGLQVCRGYEEGLLPPMNYRAFMGYDFHRRLMGRFTRNIHMFQPDTVLLGMMNVKYILVDKPVENDHLKPILGYDFRYANPKQMTLRPDLPPAFFQFALYENKDYLPKFIWSERIRAMCNLNVLDIKPGLDNLVPIEGTQPNYTYLIGNTLSDVRSSTETLRTLVVKDQKLNAQRTEGNPNEYVLEKASGDSGEILMLEAPFPGWVCRWDGGAAPLERINSIMMGVEVPEGTVSFRFRYEPFSFRLGLFISCSFAMLLSGMVFFLRYPEKPAPFKRKRKT